MKTTTDQADFTDLEKAIAKLSRLEQVSLLSLAMGEGMKPIIEDANGRAPSPAVKGKINVENGVVRGKIGFTKEKWYYRFYETGASPHEIKGPLMIFEGRDGTVITRQVQNAGGLPADPILRPALDSQKDEALRRIRDTLVNGILGITGDAP